MAEDTMNNRQKHADRLRAMLHRGGVYPTRQGARVASQAGGTFKSLVNAAIDTLEPPDLVALGIIALQLQGTKCAGWQERQ